MDDAPEFELLDPRFTDPVAASEYLESLRWADGVFCPHCGESEREPYRLNVKGSKRRLWKCRACRKQFTVTVGTIFESSHVPLNKWLAAFYLLCSSKKGMSAHQLHRMLKVSYKTAWFIFHRVREAMKDPAFTSRLSGTVEADETYIGGKRRTGGGKPGTGGGGGGRPGAKDKNKTAVMTLVERDGRARSFRVANVTAETLGGVIRQHVDGKNTQLMTDEWRSYGPIGREMAAHSTIKHSEDEYVRGDVYTNTVESYFATLKRGVNGIYHHVSRAHLDRYLSEFDFRYNSRFATDSARTVAALSGAEGKRLKYRETR
jgi:transposase-like protein